MERPKWGGWRVRLTAGFVAVLLGALVAVLLSSLLAQFAPSHRSGLTSSTTPAPTGLATTSGLFVPAGWKQVLPGLILSDFSHPDALVASPAQPGRVAACALPPHPWPEMRAPLFVLSDDGGRTWQQWAIPVVGMIWSCDLRGDTLDPNTYALSVSHITQGRAEGYDETAVTHDGGHTWSLESAPASMDYPCATLLRLLKLPEWVEVDSCAVDPSDPTHVYAITATSASAEWRGLSLYETRDGWSSWRLLHTWGTAVRLMGFHYTSSALYVADNQDSGGGQGVYRSADAGATWKKLPLTSPLSTIDYFGPTGRLLAAHFPQLFQIDPTTGNPTLLGEAPVTQESNGSVGGVISAVAICEGSQPSLVVSGPYGTFVRALPPLGS